MAFCPPKPNELDKHDVARERPGLPGDVVQVARGIGGVEIDRGRDGPPADRQRRSRCLDRTAGRNQMSGHRLDRVDRNLVGPAAQDFLDRRRLDDVVLRRARGVGVDAVDLSWCQPGRTNRPPHARTAPRPAGSGSDTSKASSELP